MIPNKTDDPQIEQPTPLLSVAEKVMADKSVAPAEKKEIFSTILLFAGAIVVAIILNVFVFQSYEVDGAYTTEQRQDDNLQA
jgi:hypothetical protein